MTAEPRVIPATGSQNPKPAAPGRRKLLALFGLGVREGGPQVAQSAGELRALPGAARSYAALEGYATPGDGGGGLFFWSTATATDDGGTTLNGGGIGTSGPGWRRFHDGRLDVRWFGALGSGSDDSQAIQRCITAAAGGFVCFPGKTFQVGPGLRWASNTGAIFHNTTLAGTGSIKIIDLSNCSNVTWLGRLVVQGQPTQPNLTYGVYGDAVDHFQAQCIQGKSLAAVFFTDRLTDSAIETVSGEDISGVHQLNGQHIGSVLILTASRSVTVDRLFGKNVGKAATYLAVSSTIADNEHINIGSIDVILDPASIDANALGIRSGIQCAIGSVVAQNGYRGVIITHEAGNSSWNIKDVSIGEIVCRGTAAPNGIGAYIGSDEPTKNILNLSIGSISTDSTATYGVVLKRVRNSSISAIDVVGAGQDGVVADTCRDVSISEILVSSIGANGVQLNGCEQVRIGRIFARDVNTLNVAQDCLRVDAACQMCRVESVTGVSSPSAASQHARVVDIIGAAASSSVGHTESLRCANTQTILYRSTGFDRIEMGLLFAAAPPAAGTWAPGESVWNSAPAAGAPAGWICVAAGVPGTWKAMAALV